MSFFAASDVRVIKSVPLASKISEPISSVCGSEAVKVVSGDKYDNRFVVENVLSHDAKETPDVPCAANYQKARTNYWLGPNNGRASFVLNLGCVKTFKAVKLVNTHNRIAKDRATKQFKYFTCRILTFWIFLLLSPGYQ